MIYRRFYSIKEIKKMDWADKWAFVISMIVIKGFGIAIGYEAIGYEAIKQGANPLIAIIVIALFSMLAWEKKP